MLIQVLQSHIDSGNHGNCRSCPIALAVKDVIREGITPVVSVTRIGLLVDGGIPLEYAWESSLPKIATSFIVRFDASYEVKPFSFEIDIPSAHLKEKQ